MNVPLFLLHLKMSRLALASWALALLVFGALSVFWAPGIAEQETAFLPYPTLGSVPIYLVLYALIFGSGCLARRLSDDLLLILGTLPMRRHQIALGKSMFFALALLGLVLVGWFSTAVAGGIVESDLKVGYLTISTSIGLLLVLAVYSYTLMISAWCSTQGSALAFSALATFIGYMMNVIGSSYEGMSWLADMSIFHYYDPVQLMQDGVVRWPAIAILAGITVGGHAIALAIFSRRDLSV